MVIYPVAFIAGCGAAVFSLLPRENLHVGYLCFRPTARLLCLFFVASLLPRENVHVGYPEAWVPRSRDSVFFCGTYGGYLGGLFHHSCLEIIQHFPDLTIVITLYLHHICIT